MSDVSEAKRLINQDNARADEIAEGFYKLDEDLIAKDPPKVKWGRLFQKFSDSEKIKYLEELAITMNHAAYLIQEERNQLLELCQKKEQQISTLNSAMAQNSMMLQTQVARMNEQRQEFGDKISKLQTRIRELLQNGDKD